MPPVPPLATPPDGDIGRERRADDPGLGAEHDQPAAATIAGPGDPGASGCDVAADARAFDHEGVEAGDEDGAAVAHGSGKPSRERGAAGGAVEGEGAVPDDQRPGGRRDRPAPGAGAAAGGVVEAQRLAFLQHAVDERERAVAQFDAAAGAVHREPTDDAARDLAILHVDVRDGHPRRIVRRPDLEQAELRIGGEVARDEAPDGRVRARDAEILDDDRQAVHAIVGRGQHGPAGDDGVVSRAAGDAATDRSVGVRAGDRVHERAVGPGRDRRRAGGSNRSRSTRTG